MKDTRFRLYWDSQAPGLPFYATLTTPQILYTRLHAHDFYEMSLVIEGSGLHLINGQTHALATGDLVFIRPDDYHAFAMRPGQNLHRINVAFRSDLWQDFERLSNAPDWETSSMPPHISLSASHRAEANLTFARILRSFRHGAGQWELSRFFTEAACLLHREEEVAQIFPPDTPSWLVRSCQMMDGAENLREGLSRFLDLAGVSEPHLARTLKVACGLTPIAWINQQRLTRAANLLATTPMSIMDIALDCGFDNLSYFYRRFRQQFGQSPHAYRLLPQRRFVPDSSHNIPGEDKHQITE